MEKSAYICGPLTELPIEDQARVKAFYAAIADVIEEVIGVRAFVPHEHFDPIRHANFTPADVDIAERNQVRKKTTFLVVVAIEPTWGGGIEVEMAYRSDVPVLLLCPRVKLEARRISRLLRGNPAVVHAIAYDDDADALGQLRGKLMELRPLLLPSFVERVRARLRRFVARCKRLILRH